MGEVPLDKGWAWMVVLGESCFSFNTILLLKYPFFVIYHGNVGKVNEMPRNLKVDIDFPRVDNATY